MKKILRSMMALCLMMAAATTAKAQDALTTAFSNDGTKQPTEWKSLGGTNKWNQKSGYTGNCLSIDSNGSGYIELSGYNETITSGDYYQLDFYVRLGRNQSGQFAVYTSEAGTPTKDKLSTDVCMFEMSYSNAEPAEYEGEWDSDQKLSATVMGVSMGEIANENNITGNYHHIIIKVTDRNVEYKITSPKEEEKVEYSSSTTLGSGVTLGGIYYNISKGRMDDFTLAYKPAAKAVDASIAWDGLKANAGKYYDSYVLTVTKGGVETSDYTVTLPAGVQYAVADGIVTYTAKADATTLTVNVSGKTADVEVPAGNVYVKAAAYDLTDKAAFLNLPASYSPETETAVNGFTTTAYRYAYSKGTRMLQNGLFFNSNELALFFPGYGITCGNSFSVQFLEHQDGFVYGYVKRLANSAEYADATVTTQWSKTRGTGLDARGTSIYTGMDVYAPTDATVSISTGDAGYATYASVLPLSFNSSEAYIIKEGVGDALSATELTAAPAQTALLIKGNAEASILAIDDDTDDATGNLLQPQLFQNGNYSLTQGEGTTNNYVLGLQNEIVAFYWVGEEAATIAYGKAFLTLEDGEAAARTLKVNFGESETTGIAQVESGMSKSEGSVYDLQGRHISGQYAKGLYIVNGKKMIVK